MRILHTPPRYYPYIGGVENLCRGYVRELARRGHEVSVACANVGDAPPAIDGVPVLRSRPALNVANTNVTPALPLHLVRARADVIHTYLPTPWSADWSVLIGRLRRIPVVLTYANDIVGTGGAAYVAAAYNRLVVPTTLRSAAHILTLRPGYGELSGVLGSSQLQVGALPPGVDTSQFSPSSCPRLPTTFFFLSLLDRYHRYKGLDVLLRAMAVVARELPEVRLVVGGSGTLLDEYRCFAAELGIGDAVAFRGRLTTDELLRLYRSCTAFVLPSTSAAQEGFGMVAVEAMACGAPIIVSDAVGTADEVAGWHAGIVVPAGSVDALAAALRQVAAGQTTGMGERGRQLAVRRFSWPVVVDRLEALYRRLVEG